MILLTTITPLSQAINADNFHFSFDKSLQPMVEAECLNLWTSSSDFNTLLRPLASGICQNFSGNYLALIAGDKGVIV